VSRDCRSIVVTIGINCFLSFVSCVTATRSGAPPTRHRFVPNPCFGAVYCRLVMPNGTRVVLSDPEILGGTPVFVGTRVPVKSLFDYLEAGDSLDEFLETFPSVTREQAVAALELARSMTEAHATAAR